MFMTDHKVYCDVLLFPIFFISAAVFTVINSKPHDKVAINTGD